MSGRYCSALLTRLAPWIAFLGAAVTYLLTVEPGASFWDCPEYIDGALRLEIGHPPGNPFWLLTHRIVSLAGGGTGDMAVLAVNLASAFFTAWSAGLLCACAQRVLRRLLRPGERKNPLASFAVDLGSLAGSLCLAWSDSAWFSAVEAEVYAMSLWMTAICVWLAILWMETPDTSRRVRLLFVIVYILGLSVGVHQLTMLVIPAIALMICYGRCGARPAHGRQWIALLLGICAVGFLLWTLVKGLPRLVGAIELFGVNRLGMPYNVPSAAGWTAILILLFIAAMAARKCRRPIWQTILFCSFFLSLGISSYALVIIRAAANPPMNQGDPSDIFSFITYVDRDQYGSAPLIYGETPYSRPVKREHVTVTQSGDSVWKYYGFVHIPLRPYYAPASPGAIRHDPGSLVPETRRRLDDSIGSVRPYYYVLSGYKSRIATTPELSMWFPRIYSSNPDDLDTYADWTGMTPDNMDHMAVSGAVDSLGNPVPLRDASGKITDATACRPTYAQHLRMLAGYQAGYMYFRYLLWNYSGRQNDVHSTGEVEHGNFITGITPLDNLMLGAEERLPAELGVANPGRHRYFMVPLILGIAGLIMLCRRGRRGRRAAWTSAVLFLMTGLAIVVYLNQTPGEPRERDYSFVGSFWTFAFWIEAAMTFVLLRVMSVSARRPKWLRRGSMALTAACVCAVPGWMLAENYRDHDRSGRYPADDYAAELLESLPRNAIFLTSGDNHTFPLWYGGHARGIRTDVTVINTNYLQLAWQVAQLARPDENGRRVPMTIRPEMLAYGRFAAVRVGSDTAAVNAIEALHRLYADRSATPRLPSSRLIINHPDSSFVFDITEQLGISPGGVMTLRQLAILDIVATNAALLAEGNPDARPVVWHRALASNAFFGWKGYTSPLPYGEMFNPTGHYDASASRLALISQVPRGKAGNRYIDPVVGGNITYRRMSLMTEAERAIAEGDTVIARKLLDRIVTYLPFSEWAPQVKGFSGRMIDEAELFASLADTLSIYSSLADSLIQAEKLRNAEFREYHDALPPRLRRALIPSTRHRARSGKETP